MEVIVTIVSKLVYFTYLWDKFQPSYIGVKNNPLTTVDGLNPAPVYR